MIQAFYESTPESLDFGKGMGLAALIGYLDRSSLLDPENVRCEVPSGIRGSRPCLEEQVLQRGRESERPQRDVFAEVGAESRIERDRVAFVQCHNRRDGCWFPLNLLLPDYVRCTYGRHAAGKQKELCQSDFH